MNPTSNDNSPDAPTEIMAIQRLVTDQEMEQAHFPALVVLYKMNDMLKHIYPVTVFSTHVWRVPYGTVIELRF